MPPETPTDEAAAESGQELVQFGAESLASLGGAAAGTFLGPPGALVGAAAGPSVVRMLAWAGRAIRHRFSSQNEEVRVGTALYVALERIKERESDGERPRQDGLFDADADPRGMLEGTLLSAARSYDEMKVPYMGAFYASFVFEEGVGVDTAHFFLSLWDRLTYHQLCVLAYFADPAGGEDRLYLQAVAEEEGVAMTSMLAAELMELTGLGLLGVRLPDGKVTEFGGTAGTVGSGASVLMRAVGQLAPMELGETFVRMAELDKIPDTNKEEIVVQLRGGV